MRADQRQTGGDQIGVHSRQRHTTSVDKPNEKPNQLLERTGQAALDVHRNLHHGKVAVLCLAPHEGLGVRDHLLRERHLTEINRFRNE